MPVNKVTLTGLFYEQSGDPFFRVKLRAVLMGIDVETGQYVAQDTQEVYSDELGVAQVQLFPNASGTRYSYYRITATTPAGVVISDSNVSIPNNDCNLADVEGNWSGEIFTGGSNAVITGNLTVLGSTTLNNFSGNMTGGTIDGITSLRLPHGTATPPTGEALIYWDDTADRMTVGTGSVAREMASVDGAQTLTNKSFDLGLNALRGTFADFNAACTDNDFASVNSPVFTGNPQAPTPAAGDNDASIATTAFVATAVANGVSGGLSNSTPIMDGTATAGVATSGSRADHVHPTDTSRASVTYVNSQDAGLQSQITANASAISGKADKTYVDSQDAALQSQINQKASSTDLTNGLATKVSKSGDTMSGNLHVPNLVNVTSVLGPNGNTSTLHLSGGDTISQGAAIYLRAGGYPGEPGTGHIAQSGTSIASWNGLGLLSAVPQASGSYFTRQDYVQATFVPRDPINVGSNSVNQDTLAGFISSNASPTAPFSSCQILRQKWLYDTWNVDFALQVSTPAAAMRSIRYDQSFASPWTAFALSDGGTYNMSITGTSGGVSDRALKENIQPIQNALDKVQALNGYTFNFITNPDVVEIGLIYQEVEAVLPEATRIMTTGLGDDVTDHKVVLYANLTALLVEAVKELSAKLDTALARIAELEAK